MMGSTLRNLVMRTLNRSPPSRLSSSSSGGAARRAKYNGSGANGNSNAAVALVVLSVAGSTAAATSAFAYHQKQQGVSTKRNHANNLAEHNKNNALTSGLSVYDRGGIDAQNTLPLIPSFLGSPRSVVLCASAVPDELDTSISAYDDSIENEILVINTTDPSYYYERVQLPDRSLTESHAIFGPLQGKGRVERYNFYRRVNVDKTSLLTHDKDHPVEVAVGDVQFGNKINGHDGIVHGGIISLLFDDAMGWGYEAMVMADRELDSDATIVTANLNIDFRSPLPENTRGVVRIYHVKSEGRKIYFSARLESHCGKILFAEATSLYIKLKKEPTLDKRSKT